MSFPVQDSGRVGQSTYWVYFGANMILAPIFLFGGIFALFGGNFALGGLCLFVLLPLAIFFRIIMMRRCRDIGWPAFLPWIAIGFSMLFGMINGFRLVGHPGEASGMFVIPMILSLLDFALMIAIGCVASKGSYVAHLDDPEYVAHAAKAYAQNGYGSGDTGLGAMPAGSLAGVGDADFPDHDRWDAAIARQLAARAGQSQPVAQQSNPVAAATALRPATGFGRKMV